MARRRVLLSWSSGKDSAWTLHRLRQDPNNEVVAFLTTVNAEFDRVAMHAVRLELLRAQAAAAGVDLWSVPIPYPCTNEQYEQAMSTALAHAREAGIDAIAFGDLFLEDIRRYREERMAEMSFELLFPLWGLPTDLLAQQMVGAGLRARITCIDPRKLDDSFAGREFDSSFLHDLPAGVDPCGENGEFHTFVYGGPMFSSAVPVRVGETVRRDGFVFTDLLPA